MENEKSLEEKAKNILKLWVEDEIWNINKFDKYEEIKDIMNYLKDNGYIEIKFPNQPKFKRYESTEKGREWVGVNEKNLI
jgi:basic membrane lipoprotein Med (substrate-binding protein (PBP1-ABC) superfamily)